MSSSTFTCAQAVLNALLRISSGVCPEDLSSLRDLMRPISCWALLMRTREESTTISSMVPRDRSEAIDTSDPFFAHTSPIEAMPSQA